MKKRKNLCKGLALVFMLAMVLLAMPNSAVATLTGDVSVDSGEMIAIDWVHNGTTHTGTVVDAVTLSSTDYWMPRSFVLWVHGSPSFSYNTNKISVNYLYANGQDKAYRVNVVGITSGTTETFTVTLGTDIYSVDLPPADSSPYEDLTSPDAVNGYLPVGQYAAGWMWGSIYADGSHQDGTYTKLTDPDSLAGVSLGACGGYVQVEFDSPILNNSDNPYGVDFIVYGNAFVGNSEAGSVKVSQDGVDWYELAGSRYFSPETLRNVNVSYTLGTVGNTTRVKYRIWDSNGLNTGWQTLNYSTDGWWPEYDPYTENYGAVSGIGTAFDGTHPVNEATWSNNETVITYNNVTLIKDFDDADYYTFGYADVHLNGSNYGEAFNPYLAGHSTGGGDGFDISWAVEDDGTPIYLNSISYVRVYTSAGILYDYEDDEAAFYADPYIYVAPAINETSTEVCGIFAASGENEDSTYIPQSIYIDGIQYTINDFTQVGGSIYELVNGGWAGTIVYIPNLPTGVHVFINGTNASYYESLIDEPIQIILQYGDADPLILYIT